MCYDILQIKIALGGELTKMKKKRSILALLLVFSLVLASVALSGCKPDDDDVDEDYVVPEEDLSPAFANEALRFSGSFTVMTELDRSEGQAWNIVDLVEENNLGDSAIKEAVATRNNLIRRNFGVKIARATSQNIGEDSLQAVNSGDDSYDAFMLSITNGLNLACGGGLLDFSMCDYIDLNQDWWDQGITESLLLAGGAYIAVGDLLTVDKDGTWCVLFNKDNLSEMNRGLTDTKLYQMVKDGIGQAGGWTLEYLMTQAQAHSTTEFDSNKNIWATDYQGSGKYGIFTQKEVATVFLQSAGYTPTVVDNSLAGVKANMDSNAFGDAVDMVWQNFGQRTNTEWFLDLDTVVGNDPVDGWQNIARGGFMANKATFFICHVGTINLIRDMKSDFGILPIPKLFESQTEYGNTIQYGNGHCYVVPDRAGDSLDEKSTYILEAMAYYSSQEYGGETSLNYAYYDIVLRGKASRDDDSWEMLDLIFDTRVYDFACALDIKNVNNVIRESVCELDYRWSSKRDSFLDGFDDAIAEALKGLTNPDT